MTLSTNPGARTRASMAYDAERRVMVLFGGRGTDVLGAPAYLNDTWEYDGHWRQRSPSTAPSERTTAGLAYDEVHHVMVLFGGLTNLIGRMNDTWTWDGVTWSQMAPSASPSARSSPKLVWSPLRKTILLFGGSTGTDAFADLWEWNGSNWTELTTTGAASPRSQSSVAWDPIGQQLVQFGGTPVVPIESQAETYVLNMQTLQWSKLSVAHPPGRWASPFTWDGRSQGLVIFGGFDYVDGGYVYLADQWRLSGNVWSEFKLTTAPTGRTYHVMAYDSARRKVVLYGGENAQGRLGDTWEY